MRKILVVIGLSVLFSCLVAARSEAAIFLNFDPPTFTVDSSPGDYSHTYTTSLGNIYFNGRIYNKLASKTVPDHTTGSADFLKNTGAEDVLTMTFDFPVESFSFWARTSASGVAVKGEAYDAQGGFVGAGDINATNGSWLFNNIDHLSSPVSKLIIYSSSGNGNNFAIDDLTLNPVPEPATMLLFATGMLGMGALRRKKTAVRA